MEDSFATVMEFSVALAGFSAVAIALSHEPGALASLDRFRALNLLGNTLGPGFGASFVLVLGAFGVSGPALWRLTSSGLLVGVAVSTAVPVLLSRRMLPADRMQLASGLWVLAIGGNSILAVVLVANIAGMFGSPGPGPIMASLMWLLFFAAVLFVRMLVDRPAPPAE